MVRCPSCGLAHDWEKNPLRPYCSAVCKLLWQYGLDWRIQPYRIIVGTHPHLIIQTGPVFDLRDAALKGARERTLATERKRGQRARLRTSPMSRAVTPTAQHSAVIQGSDAVLGAEKVDTSLGGVQRDV
jgi:hypothetical protein